MSLLKRFNETKAFQKFSEGLTKVNESAIAQNVRPGNSEPPVTSVGPNQIDPRQGYKYGRIEDQTNQVPPGNNIIDGKMPTPNTLPPGSTQAITHDIDTDTQETDTPVDEIPAAERWITNSTSGGAYDRARDRMASRASSASSKKEEPTAAKGQTTAPKKTVKAEEYPTAGDSSINAIPPEAQHLIPPNWKPMLANMDPPPIIRVVGGRVTMEVPTALEPQEKPLPAY